MSHPSGIRPLCSSKILHTCVPASRGSCWLSARFENAKSVTSLQTSALYIWKLAFHTQLAVRDFLWNRPNHNEFSCWCCKPAGIFRTIRRAWLGGDTIRHPIFLARCLYHTLSWRTTPAEIVDATGHNHRRSKPMILSGGLVERLRYSPIGKSIYARGIKGRRFFPEATTWIFRKNSQTRPLLQSIAVEKAERARHANSAGQVCLSLFCSRTAKVQRPQA
mmetsp:Transcript_56124/g.99930  ORF Transcript_56124/g.99930 Transcript_56124/m.99930 type:complete len:220 (+) Transcript_56124:2175-2834(+)